MMYPEIQRMHTYRTLTMPQNKQTDGLLRVVHTVVVMFLRRTRFSMHKKPPPPPPQLSKMQFYTHKSSAKRQELGLKIPSIEAKQVRTRHSTSRDRHEVADAIARKRERESQRQYRPNERSRASRRGKTTIRCSIHGGHYYTNYMFVNLPRTRRPPK